VLHTTLYVIYIRGLTAFAYKPPRCSDLWNSVNIYQTARKAKVSSVIYYFRT